MLVIRFFRVGKKNQPSFKIVVTEKINPPRGGRFVEEVGFYNPVKNERKIEMDRIEYWLSKGAKPSETVQSMINYARKQAGKVEAAAVQPEAEAGKKS